MIVGACGFGSTGSSVVTDYLKEFDGIQVKDDLEFTYVSGTDGLLYLEQQIQLMQLDVFKKWLQIRNLFT